MFSEIQKLIKHSGIYALGVALNAALSFLLVPLYTRFLTQADFGRLEILQTFLKILLFVLPLGFASAILKCYHRDTRNAKEKRDLVNTAFLFIFFFSLLGLLLLSFFASSVSRILIKLDFSLLIYFLLATSLFTVLIELGLAVLRARERSRHYTTIFLLRFILTLVLTIYLIGWLKLGLSGAILGNLLAQILTLLFFLPSLLSYVKISYSLKALTKLLSFGLPILPASLAMWVMDLSDRYFLRFFSTLEAVAVYSLGYRIGFVLEVLLVIPFQLAWPAFSFRLAATPGHKKIYVRTFTYFFLIGIFAVLGLSLFAPEIIKIIATSEYQGASGIVPLVSLSYLFYGLHFILATGIHLREKTKYYPLLIIFPAFLNVILNFFFVPLYGFKGAAFTTFISFACLLIFTYWTAQHFYPLRQEWRRLTKILAIGLIIFGLSKFFLSSSFAFWAKIFLLFFFWLGLWGLEFFEKEETIKIRGLFKKIISFK